MRSRIPRWPAHPPPAAGPYCAGFGILPVRPDRRCTGASGDSSAVAPSQARALAGELTRGEGQVPAAAAVEVRHVTALGALAAVAERTRRDGAVANRLAHALQHLLHGIAFAHPRDGGGSGDAVGKVVAGQHHFDAMGEEGECREQGQPVDPQAAARKEHAAQLHRGDHPCLPQAASLRLDPLLKDIVTTAAEVIDCAGTSIFLVDQNSSDLHFKATTIKASNLVSDILIPLNKSIAGEILISQKPLIVYDVQSDKRFFNKIDKILGFESKTLIGVPLKINDRCIGVLEAVNKKGDEIFSEDDVDTLTALAAHASIAIENARLYESVLDTANILEQKVQERTSELQLRNEELSAYDHTVAHDLKNLLSIIISYSKILEDDYPLIGMRFVGSGRRARPRG